MSTFLLAGKAGQSLETISAGTGGSLQGTGDVELQINQATTAVTEGSGTRQLQREEVLILLNIYAQYIQRMTWPYAAS